MPIRRRRGEVSRGRRLQGRETFIPLDHPPGHRAEADFGHPGPPFDACVLQAAVVDKYQPGRFDHNSSSVPRR